MFKRLQRSAEEFNIYWRRYKGPHNKVPAKDAFLLWIRVLKLIWISEIFCRRENPTSKILAKEYFSVNPEAWEEVKKATCAWHNPKIINAHFFQESHFEDVRETSMNFRDEKCRYCGRTREQVRYDNLSHFCEKAPCPVQNIKDVLNDESKKALSLIERAKKEAPKWIQKRGMSGETLAFLHKTHGFTLEIIGSVVNVPEWAEKEYEKEMNFEKDFSRASMNKIEVRIRKNH